MGRKSKSTVSTRVEAVDIIDTAVTQVVTPKKGRRAVKVEKTSAVAKPKGKRDIDSDEELVEPLPKSTVGIRINRVKSAIVLKDDAVSKAKKAPVKRKAKTEDDVEDEEGPDETKAKKKRKTKEEKEAEAMPLAARTIVGTLKKAMHIGAHVSGAGGKHDNYVSSSNVGYC